MSPRLALALGPVLQQIAEMTARIKLYDRQLQQTEYPETQAQLKVRGGGHLAALSVVLTLSSRLRFGRSRDVGCYLGLWRRRSQSGDHDTQLCITKSGKPMWS
ncbi:transposase [Granulicella arctica]|uniref:Transposase n=1 Tax=Granulicella arctica TaxID=940613 RepID=A0A7Y9PHU7_9BACT|nr:transposase [Granulicella arctica]NYF80010.1 transposase [Granulicella arctica]